MCVAILKPADKDVSKEDMEACFKRNPDGAGFMYHQDGKVEVRKGFFTFDKFWKEYEKAIAGPAKDTCVAIHFRIGTSGLKDKANCHPHIASEEVAFIHNGIMSEWAFSGKGQDHKSDTAHFMDGVIRPLVKKFGPDFLKEANLYSMIEKSIGHANKMVFLTAGAQPFYWIMNEKQGDWAGGVWFSNLFWKPSTYAAPATGAYQYGGYNDRGKWGGRSLLDPAGGNTAPASVSGEKLSSVSVKGCWCPEYAWTQETPQGQVARKGKWLAWDEYETAFPNFDGPYEWYLQGKQKGDKLEEKFRQFPPGYKKKEASDRNGMTTSMPSNPPSCESGSCETRPDAEAGTFIANPESEDSLLEEAMEREASRYEWNQEHCMYCVKDLTPDEILADNGLCITCMLEIESKMKR